MKTSQVENNAAKTIALDHLGVIAARIRSTIIKFKPNITAGMPDADAASLKPLDEVRFRTARIAWPHSLTYCLQILSNVNIKALEKLLSTHQDVASHLCKRSSEDQAFDVRLSDPGTGEAHFNPFLERSRAHRCHLGPGIGCCSQRNKHHNARS